MITFKEAKERVYPNISNSELTDTQREEIRQIAISSFAAPHPQKIMGDKKQVDFSLGNDKNIPMKCDMCGKTFNMGQLEHDSNFGYVCKKCENKETC